jgi:hypothetical protein
MYAPTRIALAFAVIVGSASTALADDYLLIRSGSAYASQYQQPSQVIEGRNVAVHGYASVGAVANDVARSAAPAFSSPDFSAQTGSGYSGAADSVYRASHFDMGS